MSRARSPSNILWPVLERLWVASYQLCGKLLQAVLPTLLAALETHHGVVLSSVTQ